MKTIKQVTKNLVGMEDLLTGVGHVQQKRGGKLYNIGKMDVPYAVASEDELKKVDVDKYTYARIGSIDYRYDPADLLGDVQIPGRGSWNRSSSVALFYNTIADAKKGDNRKAERLIITSLKNKPYYLGGEDFVDNQGNGWGADATYIKVIGSDADEIRADLDLYKKGEVDDKLGAIKKFEEIYSGSSQEVKPSKTVKGIYYFTVLLGTNYHSTSMLAHKDLTRLKSLAGSQFSIFPTTAQTVRWNKSTGKFRSDVGDIVHISLLEL